MWGINKVLTDGPDHCTGLAEEMSRTAAGSVSTVFRLLFPVVSSVGLEAEKNWQF